MATYVLMCVAKTGSTAAENEGQFDSVVWKSPGSSAQMPDPATAPLAGVQAGDLIGFAVQVLNASGSVSTSELDWVSVSVSPVTQPGNRWVRYADNDSPFRIGTGTRPNTILLAAKTGVPGPMQDYDANGNPVAPGTGTFRGMPPLPVYRDIPPGQTSPSRTTSQYEAVIGCSLTDASGQTWQFTFDPEVDVDNGN